MRSWRRWGHGGVRVYRDVSMSMAHCLIKVSIFYLPSIFYLLSSIFDRAYSIFYLLSSLIFYSLACVLISYLLSSILYLLFQPDNDTPVVPFCTRWSFFSRPLPFVLSSSLSLVLVCRSSSDSFVLFIISSHVTLFLLRIFLRFSRSRVSLCILFLWVLARMMNSHDAMHQCIVSTLSTHDASDIGAWGVLKGDVVSFRSGVRARGLLA